MKVVVSHVAQMRAGVGESDQHIGMADDVAQRLLTIVRNDGVPADVVAEFGTEIEKRFDDVLPAFFRHIGEGLADQRRVGT